MKTGARQWFATSWRPFRRALPPTTAGAVAAIAGIFVVIAIFEAGFSAPMSFSALFVLISLAAAVAFVSLRTSLLVLALLALSVILAGYAYAALGIALPSLAARMTGLVLCAAAIGHMVVSWRDAGDFWRTARDVTENALSDGLRRYLFVVGGGAASLFVSARTFDWSDGLDATVYFLMTTFISLLLAPALMTAMSAQFKKY